MNFQPQKQMKTRYTIKTETRRVESNGWVESGDWHTAYFHPHTNDFKGCPCGRSQTSVENAITDLIRRVNQENGTSLSREQLY